MWWMRINRRVDAVGGLGSAGGLPGVWQGPGVLRLRIDGWMRWAAWDRQEGSDMWPMGIDGWMGGI